MSRWVGIHNRIVAAIGEQVIACGSSVGTQVVRVVGGKETANFGVIISALQVVELGFFRDLGDRKSIPFVLY